MKLPGEKCQKENVISPENGIWQACLNRHPDHTQITYIRSAGRGPTTCEMCIQTGANRGEYHPGTLQNKNVIQFKG